MIMSKGYARNQERLQTLNSFGKDLTRRAKSKCEFCESAGVKLSVYEVIAAKEEPEIEYCMLVCQDCANKLDNLKKANPAEMRFLENTIWSEVPIIKACAIYVLRKLADKNGWAYDALENAYIDSETEELLNKIEL